MTVRKTRQYSDTWDQFIEAIYATDFSFAGEVGLERLVDQLGWDEKIAMIVALSKDWTAAQKRNNGGNRLRQREAAAAEVARMTRDDTALLPYVSEDARALLPKPGVRRQPGNIRRQATNNATAYFRRLDHSSASRIHQIIRRELRLSAQLWAGIHPYGPAVPIGELNRYRNDNAPLLRGRRRKMTVNPAGMTPERALEIAMRLLR